MRGGKMFFLFLLYVCMFQGKLFTQYYPQWETGLTYDMVLSNITVQAMPFEIRNVPVHEGDDMIQTFQGPINRTYYEVKGWMPKIGFRIQRSYKNISFAFSVFLSHMNKREDMDERNYTNDPGGKNRGIGAMLTYCKLRTGGIILAAKKKKDEQILDATAEFAIETPLSRMISLGSSVSYFVIKASNGWDRFEKFEVQKTYNLAHVFPTSIYLKARLYDFLYTYAGSTFFGRILSPLGREASIRQTHEFIVGISVITPADGPWR